MPLQLRHLTSHTCRQGVRTTMADWPWQRPRGVGVGVVKLKLSGPLAGFYGGSPPALDCISFSILQLCKRKGKTLGQVPISSRKRPIWLASRKDLRSHAAFDDHACKLNGSASLAVHLNHVSQLCCFKCIRIPVNFRVVLLCPEF